MNKKQTLKIAVDGLMTLGLLFLMGYQLWGNAAHEWAGAGMFLLFLFHHVLNRNWYRGIVKGKYTPARIFQLMIDLLVFLDMVGLMVSGVILSTHVFAFLPISVGTGFARILHMTASHWGFVLMSLHLGLHWGIFVGMAKKALNLRRSRARQTLLSLLGVSITVYGLAAFVRRDLLTYMLVRTQFVFLDFGEPIPRFYLDYTAIMGAFIFLAYSISCGDSGSQSISPYSRNQVPDAILAEGLATNYSGGSGMPDDVSEWLATNGITTQQTVNP